MKNLTELVGSATLTRKQLNEINVLDKLNNVPKIKFVYVLVHYT